MTIRRPTLAALALLLLAPALPPAAGDAVTLTGEYVWNHRDNSGDLRAVFTPTGAAAWAVEFHFTFRGKPHVYRGTAEGSLDEGSLSGTVKNENGRRTFSFGGTFENGSFRGTHAELDDGEPYPTGTLTLSRR